MITIRNARKEDDSVIRGLIYKARLNPMGIHWRRFRVAVNEEDQVLGCGQVKPHNDGTRELASIVVREGYRRQGIGRAVIQRLLEENTGVLYLTTRGETGPYYEPFGFYRVEPGDLPPYFRRIWTIFSVARRLFRLKEELLVMRRDPSFQTSAES